MGVCTPSLAKSILSSLEATNSVPMADVKALTRDEHLVCGDCIVVMCPNADSMTRCKEACFSD
jgi:hypothetical protein